MYPYVASSLELCSVLQPSMKSLTVGEFSVKSPFLSSLELEQSGNQEVDQHQESKLKKEEEGNYRYQYQL